MIKSIDLVVQALPGIPDAIGEYTACLAHQLSPLCTVRVLTQRKEEIEQIAGVTVQPCFSLTGKGRFNGLSEQLGTTTADVVILQYNPFGWGKRGWAPDFVWVMQKFKRSRPDIMMGVMFHETYMMNPGLKSWVMRLYQRWQYRKLVDLADINLYSTGNWARQEAERCRSGKKSFVHLPVGSNLPLSTGDRNAVRARYGLSERDFVCGAFGSCHPSRMPERIEATVAHIGKILPSGRQVKFLNIGRDTFNLSLSKSDMIETGKLDALAAADAIAAADIMIHPLTDGISTRRTSVMAALQQGIPVLTSFGHNTEALWSKEGKDCVFLCANDDICEWQETTRIAVNSVQKNRSKHSQAAKEFYGSHFAWPVITAQLLKSLNVLTGSVHGVARTQTGPQ